MAIKTLVHSAHQHLQQIIGTHHIKKTHIYELFAAAFGFKSYAALKAQAVFIQSSPETSLLDSQAVAQRYEALAYPPAHSKLITSAILDLLHTKTISVAGIQEIVSSLCGPDWSPARNFERFEWEEEQEDDDWDENDLGSEENSGDPDVAQTDASLELWNTDGEPNAMMMDGLEAAAQGGNALAHYALALIYGDGLLDYPEDQLGYTLYRYQFNLAAHEGELSDADKKWVEAAGEKSDYHALSKSFQHFREAARLGQQNALLKLAELFENAAFFEQADPPIVADPAEIARIALHLDRDEDFLKWLTVAAEYGDTEAMRQLIEIEDRFIEVDNLPDIQTRWEWFYLAKLCGVDLSHDHYYAINEYGGDYDEDVDGNAFVGGRGGVELEPLKAEQDAAAQLAAQKMFAKLQPFRR